MERIRDSLADKKKVYMWVPVVFLVALIGILLVKQLGMIIVGCGFVIVNVIITSYKKYTRIPVELEIITFGTVFCTYYSGLKAGLFVAVLGGLVSNLYYGFLSVYVLPKIMGYALSALLCAMLGGTPLWIAGTVITIVKNIVVFITYELLGYDAGLSFSYGISNVVVNFLLFFNLAPVLVTVIGFI